MDVQDIKLKALPILKKHGVTKASIFGSAARNKMTDASDVDFLVELPNTVHGYDYVSLKVDLSEELKSTLGRNVDIVEYSLIKKDLQPYILSNQVQIL